MAAPNFRSAGMVRATASVQASRTAPNSFTRSGRLLLPGRRPWLSTSNASETSPCRRAGQAKRRARPTQGDGLRQTQPGGIETSIGSGQLPLAASAQLVCAQSSGRISGRVHPGRSKSGRRRRQHHPLGKASEKLHKSARDRVNKPIGAMQARSNPKGKPNHCWSHQTQ